eukprot:2530001-Amphidinium_carterae.1
MALLSQDLPKTKPNSPKLIPTKQQPHRKRTARSTLRGGTLKVTLDPASSHRRDSTCSNCWMADLGARDRRAGIFSASPLSLPPGKEPISARDTT